MEFPTNEKFDESKISNNDILKWRDIPMNTIFRIDDISKINTKFGTGTILTLKDKNLNTYKCFATKTIADNLNNVNLQDGSCYIRSLGSKESTKTLVTNIITLILCLMHTKII